MDDILLSAKDLGTLEKAYAEMVAVLENNQLFVAPEKVQMGKLGEYLGTKIVPHSISPQKIELRKDHLRTLNDFQKLLGDINWIRPYIKMPNVDLQPLYEILKGDSQLTSPRILTTEARAALKKVEERLEKAMLNRYREGEDLLLRILRTFHQPTGVLWQQGPLLWIYPHISPNKTLEYYPSAVAKLTMLGIKSWTAPEVSLISYSLVIMFLPFASNVYSKL